MIVKTTMATPAEPKAASRPIRMPLLVGPDREVIAAMASALDSDGELIESGCWARCAMRDAARGNAESDVVKPIGDATAGVNRTGSGGGITGSSRTEVEVLESGRDGRSGTNKRTRTIWPRAEDVVRCDYFEGQKELDE